MRFLARIKRFMEPLSIVLIVFGIFSLCQPFTFFLYHYGFAFLGGGCPEASCAAGTAGDPWRTP